MACARSFNFDSRKAPVSVQWFTGAETNLAFNCLDRHVEAGHGERVAFFWEGNDLGEDSTTTYSQLLAQVRSQTCFFRHGRQSMIADRPVNQGTSGGQSQAVRLDRLSCCRKWLRD